MKKTVLTILALSLLSPAFAQFTKGRMLAGGSIGFSSINDKSSTGSTTSTVGTTTSFTFSPNFGYFIIDRVAVGGNMAYTTSKDNGNNGTSDKASSFVLSPLARYYLDHRIFVQGTFGFGSGKDVSTSPTLSSTTRYGIGQWSLGVGYAYFLNDHVAIEPIIKYQSQAEKADISGNPKETYKGVVINIGIQVYLDRK
jgi:hypothetical protein